MHTHVCHCSNKCVRAFNVDQFIHYSSMFYSQLVILSSPYFLISDIFSVYMILTINHLQRLLFDTSLYLLTLLSNVAEAKPLYAAAMAHYDVLEGLDKCHLKILYQPEELSSASSFSPFSSSSSFSFSFPPFSSSSSSSSSSPCSLLVPTLLLSILRKETEGFLTEIVKADMDIENRKNNPHGIAGTPCKKLVSNGSTIFPSPKTSESPLQLRNGEKHSSPSTKKILSASSPESQNTTRNINSKSSTKKNISERNYSSPTEKNGITDKNVSGDRRRNEKVEDEVEKEGKVEKVEKLPVAELILASHASLLLHALCMCLPKIHNEEDSNVRTVIKMKCVDFNKQNKGKIKEFSETKNEKQDLNVHNVDDVNKTKSSLEFDISGNLNKEREWGTINPYNKMSVTEAQEPYKMTRSCVRRCLPRGNWWLPIRVLKGFLVLQGQVPYTV